MITLKRFWTESGWKKEEIRISDFLDHLDGHLGAINSRLDTLSEYISAHSHRLSNLESRLAALEELKADFSAEKRIRENLERRIIDLEAEKQPKEEVAGDKNGHVLIPRRSVLESKHHIAGKTDAECGCAAEFLFMGIDQSGRWKAIDLTDISNEGMPSKQVWIYAYDMHPHIAEAIIAAAEKEEDC